MRPGREQAPAPFDQVWRIALTMRRGAGRRTRRRCGPQMTLPRGIAMSALSSTCLSASSIGRPCSNGRVWPYCTLTKPDFDAFSVKRPPAVRGTRSALAVGERGLDAISGAVSRTCARRSGPPVSVETTRPRIRPVPVFSCRGPPRPGIIIGSPADWAASIKICCCARRRSCGCGEEGERRHHGASRSAYHLDTSAKRLG